MSAFDGNNGMNAEDGWSAAQFDAALRGRPDAPDALASVVATAVIEFTDPIPDGLAKHHIAMSAVVARSIAHEAAQTALAARAAAATAPTVVAPAPTRKRLRRLTFAGAFSGMWAKIALGTAALAAVGTGAAVTDTLPDPVQAVFSDVAHVIGVDIPHPGEADDVDGSDGAVPAEPSVGPVTPASLPDRGGAADLADDQAEEQEAYRECLELQEDDPNLECTKPVPPGQEDDFTPPGQEDKEDKTPPGQDGKEYKTPPGQDGKEDKSPPSQGQTPNPPEDPSDGTGGGNDKVKDK